MSLFPSFRRPCPYQADLSAVMDGDWCRMCGQQVRDITDLNDAGRAALLRGCEGEVCVSYRVPVALAAAAALVVSVTPATAAQRPRHHHAPKVVQPPFITLAGAPMPMPPEPPSPPPTNGPQPNDVNPSAGPRSSR